MYLDRPTNALRWFLDAADAGYTESHIHLACLYEAPNSPIHSPTDALIWYERIAQSKSESAPRAMLALAKFHLGGRGIPISLPLARWWLNKTISVVPKDSTFYRQASAMLEHLANAML